MTWPHLLGMTISAVLVAVIMLGPPTSPALPCLLCFKLFPTPAYCTHPSPPFCSTWIPLLHCPKCPGLCYPQHFVLWCSCQPIILSLSPCHKYIFDIFFSCCCWDGPGLALGGKSNRTQDIDEEIGGWEVEAYPSVVNAGGHCNFDHMALEVLHGHNFKDLMCLSIVQCYHNFEQSLNKLG